MRSSIGLLGLFVALAVSASGLRAHPITFEFEGVVDLVDDYDDILEGLVHPGMSFSGSYTFESTEPDGDPSPTYGRYYYDNVPGEFTMTASVGPFTFVAAELDTFNFSTEIDVKDNDGVVPRDSYRLLTREVDSGEVFVVEIMEFQLTTFANLDAILSDALLLTPPDLSLFETTNRFDFSGVGEEPPGGDFLIRGTLTSLQLDDLAIDSILDIPDDQGRQVRVTWCGSGCDFPGSSTPISEYGVYRRIDATRAPERAAAADEGRASASQPLAQWVGPTDRYPPGDWDFIVSVPACCEDEYAVVAPTLADSTISGGMHYTTFFVRALTDTPWIYFDSPPDSGYSVDNLAPAVPRGLAVDYSESENELAWEESEDEDFQYFRVYRGTDPEFVPGPENLVHMTIGIGWVDSVTEGWQYHYKVSAVDFSGNESDAASPEAVTGLDEPGAPGRYALYQNAPNPLNPTTVIRYDVPSGGGSVTLEIFDVSGRLVRRLLDGQEASGRKSVVWDGKDERGARVGSGVYYCRLVAPGYKKTLKMIVVK